MERVTKFSGRVIPLPRRNVDTDLIIPAQYLTSVSRDGYGQNLFRRLRDADPEFVLNRPEFSGAQVLAAQDNFGCGSSREHAVWALQGAGIQAVIAPSFADIFSGNSAKNGLLLIRLPIETVEEILAGAKDGSYTVQIDLPEQIVTLPDGTAHSFPYDAFRKHCLMNGLDDIDYLLSEHEALRQYRRSQQNHCFFQTTASNRPLNI